MDERANHCIGAESSAALMRELNHAITVGSSERRLEILRHVTEQFLTNASRLDEEHIELFDDVFVTLTKTIEAQALAQLSTSLVSSGYAPKNTVQALAHHDEIAVSGPILSQSPALSDSDLVSIATTQNQEHLVAISRRATISEVVTDTLLKRGNTDVTHTLAKNSGARFSKAGFAVLVQRAKTDPNLTEPLSQRADIPLPILKQLISRATDTVRDRLLASADPERRQDILSIISTIASKVERKVSASQPPTCPEHTVHTLNRNGKLNQATIKQFASMGQIDEVKHALALMCSVNIDTIDLLMNDKNRNGIILACKSACLNWDTTELILSKIFVHSNSETDIKPLEQAYQEISQPAASRTLRFAQAKSTLRYSV